MIGVPAHNDQSPSLYTYVQQAPYVSPSATGLHVRDLFEMTGAEAIVICDAEQRVLGIIVKRLFFQMIGSRFGPELYLGRPISILMDTHPLIVFLDADPTDVIDIALSRPIDTFYDPVVVTYDNQYYGILTIRDLLAMSQRAHRELEQTRIQTLLQAKEMVEHVQALATQAINVAEKSQTESQRMTRVTEIAQDILDKHVQTILTQFEKAATQQDQAIKQLASRIDSIERIADIISEFAGESQLLTLNAQIEAARAGTYGRGFAVVAAEIGRLSKNIAQQAHKVSDTLHQIISYIESIVSFHEDMQQVSQRTVDVIQEAKSVLSNLFTSVELQRGNVARMSAHIHQVHDESKRVSESIQLAALPSQVIHPL